VPSERASDPDLIRPSDRRHCGRVESRDRPSERTPRATCLSFGQELQVSDMFRTHDAEVPSVESRELRFSESRPGEDTAAREEHNEAADQTRTAHYLNDRASAARA
jgi:hypothetical protein